MALRNLASARSPNKPEDVQKHIEDAEAQLQILLDLGDKAAQELNGQP